MPAVPGTHPRGRAGEGACERARLGATLSPVRTVLRGPSGDAIVFDDGLFPVVVSTWYGRASEEAVRGYFERLGAALSRARGEGTVLVNVVDSAGAEVPSAEVRRLIADLTLAWEKGGAGPDTVKAFVVVESTAIRGVLNVLNWLHGGMRSENVASLDAAVSRAVEALRAAGQPVPAGLAPGKVQRPPRP